MHIGEKSKRQEVTRQKAMYGSNRDIMEQRHDII